MYQFCLFKEDKQIYNSASMGEFLGYESPTVAYHIGRSTASENNMEDAIVVVYPHNSTTVSLEVAKNSMTELFGAGMGISVATKDNWKDFRNDILHRFGKLSNELDNIYNLTRVLEYLSQLK